MGPHMSMREGAWIQSSHSFYTIIHTAGQACDGHVVIKNAHIAVEDPNLDLIDFLNTAAAQVDNNPHTCDEGWHRFSAMHNTRDEMPQDVI